MIRAPRVRASAAIISAALAAGAASAAAATRTVGIIPPRNPAANCHVQLGTDPLPAIDRCRAREGVGPMHLPSNWTRLGPVEQTFVAINLERVNRGLAPIQGLTRSLDVLAQKGADAGEDPTFPSQQGGSFGGASIWAIRGSPLPAVYLWMYEDGPGGENELCPPRGTGGCWGHRDAILLTEPNLVGGGGHSATSTTFEMLYYPSATKRPAFVFTWSHELHYFASAPRIEPLRR